MLFYKSLNYTHVQTGCTLGSPQGGGEECGGDVRYTRPLLREEGRSVGGGEECGGDARYTSTLLREEGRSVEVTLDTLVLSSGRRGGVWG